MKHSLEITESRKMSGRRRTNFRRSVSVTTTAETPFLNIRRRHLFTTSRQMKEELIVAASLKYWQSEQNELRLRRNLIRQAEND
jgi:hypothetical protein